MNGLRIVAAAGVLTLAALAPLRAQTASAPDPATPPAPARVRTSPHETLSATIGGRSGPRITITYGRPFIRHPGTGEVRKIWGGLVAWDKPSRLGADEATLLITQAPLTFGEITIPAGAYTLYLVPSEAGTSTLAFSSALGKWGAPVDETKDVARVALTRHALGAAVDQLTFGIEGDPSGTGGLLKIAWENTQFTAAFTLVQ